MHDRDEVPTTRKPFSELWAQHQAAVYRGCLGWLNGRRDDADEAQSRVAIRAFQRFPDEFRDEEHARAWLLALARNVCMDLHRERRRGREVSLDDEPQHCAPVVAADPESAYLSGERDRLLRVLVRRLPQRLRRTVHLHVFSGMSYEDVARELGITVVNVRKRMQEVRQLLREALHHGVSLANDVPEPPPDEPRDETQTLFVLQTLTPHLDERDAALVLPLASHADDVRIAALHRYCEKHPRGWRRRLALARALVSAGRVEDAVDHYRYVTERQPFPIEHWLELGAALEAQGREPEALAEYTRGASEAGRASARHHLTGLAAAMRGDIDEARERLMLAADAEPDSALHPRAYGAICLRAGRPVEAVQALEHAITLEPSDLLTPSLLHDALAGAGRPLAAFARIAAAVAADPSNVLALERYVGDCAAAGGVAIESIASLLRLAPERASVHAVAARVVLLRGDVAEAESRLLIYQLRHPRHAQSWLALADFHLATGQPGAALDAALKARALRPDDRAVALELCRILPLAGDEDAADGFVRELAATVDADAMLLGAAGAVALAAGNRPLARELCCRAVELQPEIASLRLRYAIVLADAMRYDEATSELADAWSIVPLDDGDGDAARVALLLARLHKRNGSVERSRDWAAAAMQRADAFARVDRAAACALRVAASGLLDD